MAITSKKWIPPATPTPIKEKEFPSFIFCIVSSVSEYTYAHIRFLRGRREYVYFLWQNQPYHRISTWHAVDMQSLDGWMDRQKMSCNEDKVIPMRIGNGNFKFMYSQVCCDLRPNKSQIKNMDVSLIPAQCCLDFFLLSSQAGNLVILPPIQSTEPMFTLQ